MPTFDYATEAELFDYGTEAELFATSLRKSRRQPVGYKRFARAADAIRLVPTQHVNCEYFSRGSCGSHVLK
jgi:hypothetical protein